MTQDQRFSTIRLVTQLHVDLHTGCDNDTPESLDNSEYFRGQLEIIADLAGGTDANPVVRPHLVRACVAAARGEDTALHIETLMTAVKEHFDTVGL